jgi:hypothetical protein
MSAARFEATVDYQKIVSEEDQFMVPMIQENLDTGVYQQGPLSPKFENGVRHFQQLILNALD